MTIRWDTMYTVSYTHLGKDNGNGGLSITIPNWNTDNRGYTVKVQAKNGSCLLYTSTFLILLWKKEMADIGTDIDFLFIAECFIWQQSQGHGSEC